MVLCVAITKTQAFSPPKSIKHGKTKGNREKPVFFVFVIVLNSFPVGSGSYDLGQIAHFLDMVGTRPLKTYKFHRNTMWRLVDFGRSYSGAAFFI